MRIRARLLLLLTAAVTVAIGTVTRADLAAPRPFPVETPSEVSIEGEGFSIEGFTLGTPGTTIKATLERSGWKE